MRHRAVAGGAPVDYPRGGSSRLPQRFDRLALPDEIGKHIAHARLTLRWYSAGPT
jgi:hypothetical protein